MSKHLSLSDRALIEKFIAEDFTFAYIAKRLCRSPATISREIRLHRCFVERQEVTENDCIHYTKCLRQDICSDEPGKPHCSSLCKFCILLDCTKNCKSYASRHCKKLNKPPYVCNGCEKQHSCKLIHAYYSANRAHDAYLRELKESRSGIRTTVEDLERIDDLISPLIKKGQSINHIFASHADEIGVSEKTLYTYINDNVFLIRNMDLPKKVKYKARRKKTSVLTRIEYKFRRGRTLEDFQTFTQVNPDLPIVEMDTVKGARGSRKVLLTFIFRESNFMLIFLLKDGSQESVEGVFDWLTNQLGTETFKRLFPVILTDNGVEFKSPHNLEFSSAGIRRTRIFYCDPQASWQKAHVEKNHVLIRRILPKGTSFQFLTQEDATLIACHVNSFAREIFDNKTPFELMNKPEHKKLLDVLSLHRIPPDEVCLKPKLIKR